MMKPFTVVFLLLSFSLSLALPSEDVLLGTFPGRSGNIIVHSQQPDDSFVVFLPNDLSWSEKAIHDTHFADLVTHLMGIPPLNPSISRSSFPSSDIFNTPAANVLIVIDSIPSDVNMQILAGRTRYSIQKDAYSIDTSSRLTTLLSGQTPSTHGIISDHWFDRHIDSSVNALDSWNVASTGSRSASLQDWYTLLYSGDSLVLSASASERLSKLLSAKSFVLDPKKTSNQALFWNRKSSTESLYLSKKSQISINLDSIRRSISRSSSAFSSECSTPTLTPSSPEYDLLIEIGMIDGILAALETSRSLANKLVKDSIPDLFSFGFSGIKPIIAAYGKDSPETRCAIQWMDSSIQNLVSRIGKLYGNFLAEVVFMAPITPDPQLVSLLQNSISSDSLATCKGCIESMYPNIYLAGNLSRDSQDFICKGLSGKVNPSQNNVQIECLPEEPFVFANSGESMKVVKPVLRQAQNETSDATIFQTCLWVSVGLGIATVAASYVMFTIDVSKDMMLYAEDIKYLKYT